MITVIKYLFIAVMLFVAYGIIMMKFGPERSAEEQRIDDVCHKLRKIDTDLGKTDMGYLDYMRVCREKIKQLPEHLR